MQLVDNSNTITTMALQLAGIIIGIAIIAALFGALVRVTNAPQWLIKPVVTLGALIGMYFIFSLFF
ncbi:hypothetical protein [Caryophanon latum]|uniref:Uncharacterized protein n=1 Tax=Caryophanon latum TaxID=33977 RepID=A0A1C0YUH6_9BACL|nr:hypothetical protein [Caryophanon latum]OCS90828.1 hypothetical protein A6K76_01900 [Caryophanon latum]